MPDTDFRELSDVQVRHRAEEDFPFFLSLTMTDEAHVDATHGELAKWLQLHTPPLDRERDKEYDCLGIRIAHRPRSIRDRVRLLIMLPRTTLKTSIVTIRYPLWCLVRNAEERNLVVSNTDRNAGAMVAIARSFFQRNDQFRGLFHKILPPNFHANWSNDRMIVKRMGAYGEGSFDSVGVGANITGRHYNRIIEDDTISPEIDDLTGEMYIPRRDKIEKAVGFHRIVEPLMEPPGGGMRIVVGTRWANGDLIEYVLKHEKYKTFIRSAVENIPGDGDWTQGTPVFDRLSMGQLIQLREDLGAYFFPSLYLNQPLSDANRLFKQEQFRWFNDDEVPGESYRVLCIDPAVSKSDSADYTAFTVCAHAPGSMFVLHASRARLSPSELIKKGLDLCAEYEVGHVRLEAVSLAQALIQPFAQAIYDREMGVYLEPVTKLKGTKIERICGLQPLFERGVVRMRTSQVELQTELLEFNPETHAFQGRHDDLMDSLSMQVPIYRQQRRAEPEDKAWDGKFVLTWDSFHKPETIPRHGRKRVPQSAIIG